MASDLPKVFILLGVLTFFGASENAEYAYAAWPVSRIYQHRDRLLVYLEGREPAICFG